MPGAELRDGDNYVSDAFQSFCPGEREIPPNLMSLHGQIIRAIHSFLHSAIQCVYCWLTVCQEPF